ncbi:protein of unknown function [Candidatus Hydrogenisulfobacillus filiaventi]|uniref:ABC transporter domain-containing protein n=1 Tax=Candidatus Hydrogenisulfobacillus filiaventi TaxID=2707344 RepID=A0A6F8ZCL3_9FIRM|nr:protein of unknown function [Candidatus Hydrogenisulfobacillus filiaventi]
MLADLAPDAGPQPLITVRDLTVQYEGAPDPALQGVNLNLMPGERVLVLEPSGGGKSSLLMVLAGLLPRIIPARLTGEVLVPAGRLQRPGGRPLRLRLSRPL